MSPSYSMRTRRLLFWIATVPFCLVTFLFISQTNATNNEIDRIISTSTKFERSVHDTNIDDKIMNKHENAVVQKIGFMHNARTDIISYNMSTNIADQTQIVQAKMLLPRGKRKLIDYKKELEETYDLQLESSPTTSILKNNQMQKVRNKGGVKWQKNPKNNDKKKVNNKNNKKTSTPVISVTDSSVLELSLQIPSYYPSSISTNIPSIDRLRDDHITSIAPSIITSPNMNNIIQNSTNVSEQAADSSNTPSSSSILDNVADNKGSLIATPQTSGPTSNSSSTNNNATTSIPLLPSTNTSIQNISIYSSNAPSQTPTFATSQPFNLTLEINNNLSLSPTSISPSPSVYTTIPTITSSFPTFYSSTPSVYTVTTSTPSINPTIRPTFLPSNLISVAPSRGPSISPSSIHSNTPSNVATNQPSLAQSSSPSKAKSDKPSLILSVTPSEFPVLKTSSEPSIFVPSQILSLPSFIMFLTTESPITSTKVLLDVTTLHVTNTYVGVMPKELGFQEMTLSLSNEKRERKRGLQSQQNAYSFDGSVYFATDNEIPEDIMSVALTQAFSGKNLRDYQNYLRVSGIESISVIVQILKDDNDDIFKSDGNDKNNNLPNEEISNDEVVITSKTMNSVYVVWGLAATTVATFMVLLAAGIQKKRLAATYRNFDQFGSDTISSQGKISLSLDSRSCQTDSQNSETKEIKYRDRRNHNSPQGVNTLSDDDVIVKKVSFSEDEELSGSNPSNFTSVQVNVRRKAMNRVNGIENECSERQPYRHDYSNTRIINDRPKMLNAWKRRISGIRRSEKAWYSERVNADANNLQFKDNEGGMYI